MAKNINKKVRDILDGCEEEIQELIENIIYNIDEEVTEGHTNEEDWDTGCIDEMEIEIRSAIKTALRKALR